MRGAAGSTTRRRCACGSSNLGPDQDGDGGRFSALELRRRVLDPERADRSLVREEPSLTLAFRLLLTLVLAGSVLLAVQLLV